MSFRCLQATKTIDLTSPDFQRGRARLYSTGLRSADVLYSARPQRAQGFVSRHYFKNSFKSMKDGVKSRAESNNTALYDYLDEDRLV